MPSPFNTAVYDAFIQAVEDGETVKAACEHANASWRTISGWMADDRNRTGDGEMVAARYARARSISAEVWADKAVTAAEGAYDKSTASAAKVKADVYKWRASVANPKEYGERRNVEVSGSLVHEHIAALKAINAKHLPNATSRIALPDRAQPVDAQHVSEVSSTDDTAMHENEGRS